MDALWNLGALSIREIQEAFPTSKRPAYTTIQTTVYRLETKKAVRRAKKIGNAHIFEAVVSRDSAQRRLIDDLLGTIRWPHPVRDGPFDRIRSSHARRCS